MRAARVDANHSQIVKALRAIGASVADTSAVGKGFPDLVVATPSGDRTLLLECKDGKKSPSKRKLTSAQERFAAEWKGERVVVTSVEDALRAVGHATIEQLIVRVGDMVIVTTADESTLVRSKNGRPMGHRARGI